MDGDSGVNLTLSIWRDFMPARPLTLPGDEGWQLLDSKSGLQEEVYSWQLREDAFAGVSDDATRTDLRDRLLGRLAYSKPPAERRLSVLEEFVKAAEASIASGSATFAPSGSRPDDDSADKIQIEANPLLALTTHLKWILACFRNRPGISVSVRCSPQLTETSNADVEETIGQAETAPAQVRSRNTDRVPPLPRRVRRSTSFLRFNPERMFRLICALDDYQEMPAADVERIIQSKGDEYRRFLQSAELVHFAEGVWKAGKRIALLSAALRNERIEEVREILLGVPSFGAFAGRLGELATGTPLDTADLGRRLATYRILGEVTLLCAPVSGSGIFATPNVPEAAVFSQIALSRFTTLDREGHGLVATGEWLESMIRDEGIHPEVARRLLDEASETRLLRRSTEGSTTQLRFDDRIVHVLRIDSGLPVVVPIFLYRGDYLIPGKASVSLRIESITT